MYLPIKSTLPWAGLMQGQGIPEVLHFGQSHLFIVIPGESRRVRPGIQDRFGHEVPGMDARLHGNDGTRDCLW